MSVLELVVILVISDAVQNSMVGENTTLWGGLVAVVTLLALDFGLKAVAGDRRRVSKAIEGEPRLLVRDGRLLTRRIRTKASRPRRSGPRSARTASRGRGRAARRARDRRLDQRHPAGRRGAGVEPTAERRPHDLMRAVATLILRAVLASSRSAPAARAPLRTVSIGGEPWTVYRGHRRRDARPAGVRRCRRDALRPATKTSTRGGRVHDGGRAVSHSTSPGSTRRGALVSLASMAPCDAAPCPLYRRRGPFRWAIEAPPGASPTWARMTTRRRLGRLDRPGAAAADQVQLVDLGAIVGRAPRGGPCGRARRVRRRSSRSRPACLARAR